MERSFFDDCAGYTLIQVNLAAAHVPGHTLTSFPASVSYEKLPRRATFAIRRTVYAACHSHHEQATVSVWGPVKFGGHSAER